MAGLLDGFSDVPLLPVSIQPAGVDLGHSVVLPPGGNVFFVRGNGTTVTEYDYDPPGLGARLNASINVALRQCVATRGDVVLVLPGHTETIGNDGDAWSNIKANVAIIGLGRGTARPTITFNHANAQLDIDVANVLIKNMVFKAAGPAGTTALTVANPLNVTAAGFQFVNNEAEVGVDADQLCTDFIKLSAAADDCLIAGNYIYGATAAEITSVVTTTGAVDRLKIIGNTITAAVATAATGVLLDLDNAALLDNLILNNQLANKTASSKFVIDPHATSTGFVHGNVYHVNDSGTGPASLGFATFTTTYRFGVNYCVTADSASAILCPAADS